MAFINTLILIILAKPAFALVHFLSLMPTATNRNKMSENDIRKMVVCVWRCVMRCVCSTATDLTHVCDVVKILYNNKINPFHSATLFIYSSASESEIKRIVKQNYVKLKSLAFVEYRN